MINVSSRCSAAAAAESQDRTVRFAAASKAVVAATRPAALTDGFNWRWCDCGVRRRATNLLHYKATSSTRLARWPGRAARKLIPGGNAGRRARASLAGLDCRRQIFRLRRPSDTVSYTLLFSPASFCSNDDNLPPGAAKGSRRYKHSERCHFQCRYSHRGLITPHYCSADSISRLSFSKFFISLSFCYIGQIFFKTFVCILFHFCWHVR